MEVDRNKASTWLRRSSCLYLRYGSSSPKSDENAEDPKKKRERLSSYYEKRNRLFIQARSGEDIELFEAFKARYLAKYPNCEVLTEAEIKCGVCSTVKTLSCPRALQNFDRRMKTHVSSMDSGQRYITSFISKYDFQF